MNNRQLKILKIYTMLEVLTTDHQKKFRKMFNRDWKDMNDSDIKNALSICERTIKKLEEKQCDQ